MSNEHPAPDQGLAELRYFPNESPQRQLNPSNSYISYCFYDVLLTLVWIRGQQERFAATTNPGWSLIAGSRRTLLLGFNR